MINWITEQIGTCPYGRYQLPKNTECIDIRALVDRGGNTNELLNKYINQSLNLLENGKQIVISCDHGVSRSNSLAVAVLSHWENIDFRTAVRRVLVATDNAEIRLDMLEDVRRTLEGNTLNDGSERWLITGGQGYLGTLLERE